MLYTNCLNYISIGVFGKMFLEVCGLSELERKLYFKIKPLNTNTNMIFFYC